MTQYFEYPKLRWEEKNFNGVVKRIFDQVSHLRVKKKELPCKSRVGKKKSVKEWMGYRWRKK